MTFKPFLFFGFISPLLFATAYADNNPFSQFKGHWVLKNERWEQRWDTKTTEVVTIKNHHTDCAAINTPNSLLCTISAPNLEGHILWAYDPVTNLVHHLSSFGQQRNGVGTGSLDEYGNLSLTIRFPSEGKNTHREYRYTWISTNEYRLHSTQYEGDHPTGNFYSGAFIRANK